MENRCTSYFSLPVIKLLKKNTSRLHFSCGKSVWGTSSFCWWRWGARDAPISISVLHQEAEASWVKTGMGLWPIKHVPHLSLEPRRSRFIKVLQLSKASITAGTKSPIKRMSLWVTLDIIMSYHSLYMMIRPLVRFPSMPQNSKWWTGTRGTSYQAAEKTVSKLRPEVQP